MMASSVASGEVLKRSDSWRFSQRQKPLRSQYKDLNAVARFVEKDEEHRVKHGHLDIQFDQRGQAIDGFPEVDGLGV